MFEPVRLLREVDSIKNVELVRNLQKKVTVHVGAFVTCVHIFLIIHLTNSCFDVICVTDCYSFWFQQLLTLSLH